MLAGPLPGVYDPTGPGRILFAFFAAMAGTEGENIREATLAGLDSAARKDKHGGGLRSGQVAEAAGVNLQAARDAAAADDSVPDTLHLLLGLLHTGTAAGILDHAGVTRERLQQAAARLFTATTLTSLDGTERRVVGDGAAEHAVAIAHQIATRRGQSEVRTEHLLFELTVNEAASSRRILDHLGKWGYFLPSRR